MFWPILRLGETKKKKTGTVGLPDWEGLRLGREGIHWGKNHRGAFFRKRFWLGEQGAKKGLF